MRPTVEVELWAKGPGAGNRHLIGILEVDVPLALANASKTLNVAVDEDQLIERIRAAMLRELAADGV